MDTAKMTGSWIVRNCYVNAAGQANNQGCGISGPAGSFGAPFNTGKGAIAILLVSSLADLFQVVTKQPSGTALASACGSGAAARFLPICHLATRCQPLGASLTHASTSATSARRGISRITASSLTQLCVATGLVECSVAAALVSGLARPMSRTIRGHSQRPTGLLTQFVCISSSKYQVKCHVCIVNTTKKSKMMTS